MIGWVFHNYKYDYQILNYISDLLSIIAPAKIMLPYKKCHAILERLACRSRLVFLCA